MKFEILNYVQAMETNYTEAIQEQKSKCEKVKKELRKEKSKHVNDVIEKSDLENLFVDCVEDVRRNVIKRRLKAEIVGKKKIGKFDENSAEAQEFEESLLKLANLAKDRVKYSEFTTQDRNNLLDLFVNNEQTLLKIYEILFPKKAGSSSKLHGISSKVKNSQDSIYNEPSPVHNDLLKGDSIARSSGDDTQAATDMQQNSTVLPSILPAMNSIQSNDMMNSIIGVRSTNNGVSQSPRSNFEAGSGNKYSQNYRGNKNQSLMVGSINQQSQNYSNSINIQ